MSDESREAAAIAERYARRSVDDRYGLLKPDVWQSVQERQRAVLQHFAGLGWRDLGKRRLVEVGCGHGPNLLEFLRMGFVPDNLIGVDLLPARAEAARRVLPASLRVHCGDAIGLELPPSSQDVVFVATVFSSVLDRAVQDRLAATMWRWVKPGGGVLWYDFTVDNPRNPDVAGIGPARIRGLFPQGRVGLRRLTLAPPLARAVTRIHPSLYSLFNLLPTLRTHVLAWVAKPDDR